MVRVIIADDTYETRTLLERLVKAGDSTADVECVSDGSELVDRVKKGNYDLILTDNTMIGMCGLDAIKLIREFNKDTKIYMISGDWLVEDTALKYGANGFISKGNRDLILRIKDLVNKKI